MTIYSTEHTAMNNLKLFAWVRKSLIYILLFMNQSEVIVSPQSLNKIVKSFLIVLFVFFEDFLF